MNPRYLLVLLAACLLLVGVTSAWYDSDWEYRKEFTINNTGSNLTNYQMMFTVYRSSGSDSGFTTYLYNKCEEDYDDIRFVASDDTTVLDYWIESSSSTVASVWVELDSLPTGDTDFYLYYNNSGASAVSNGDNTFIFFDDFEDNSFNTTKWDATNTPTESGQTLILDENDIAVSDNTFGRSVVFKTRFKTSSVSSSGWRSAVTWGDGVPLASHALAYCVGNYGNQWTFLYDSGSSYVENINIATATANTYYDLEMIFKPTQGCDIYLWQSSGSRPGSAAHSTSNGTLNTKKVRLGGHTGSATQTCDYTYIRKYAATEPTVSAWGSEEEVPPGGVLFPDFSGVPASGHIPLTVYFTDESTTENCTISTWQWSFGDSTPNSTQQNPAHTYTTSGLYTVGLTITNTSFGITNSTTKTAYINATVNTDAPNADFTVTETCGNTSDTFYFIDFSTGGGLYAWNWSFGDGSYSELRNPTHQYAGNGTYDVNLTVWGAYGVDSLLRSNLITIPCGAPTPTPTATGTPTPTAGPVYTGTIPGKPIVTGTVIPTATTDEYNNWSWSKTGGFLLDIKNDLLPELFNGVIGFVPFLVIIIGFGIVVVLVEGWIRLMR